MRVVMSLSPTSGETIRVHISSNIITRSYQPAPPSAAKMMSVPDVDLGSVETDSVLTLMECPVCLDHITPPVKQCVKGHLVCVDCFPRLAHCPTCRGNMSEERNLAMEQISRLLNYPCRYNPMGCKKSFPLAKKSAHERDCPFLQLKCPFHGQCAFNGALADVVPHLASEHQVTPVPVQPAGILFYRAKNFYRRNVWTLIFQWGKNANGNLFRFIVRHVHSSTVGRTENCNLLVAHVQYIGPDSMASKYAYRVSFFQADTRRTSQEFEGLVSSTLKPLESMCSKDADVFVNTSSQTRNYIDQWGNLNFIIRMKKLDDDEEDVEMETAPTPSTSTSTSATIPSSATSSTTASTSTSSASTSSSAPTEPTPGTSTAAS